MADPLPIPSVLILQCGNHDKISTCPNKISNQRLNDKNNIVPLRIL